VTDAAGPARARTAALQLRLALPALVGALACAYAVLLIGDARDIGLVVGWHPDSVITWVLVGTPHAAGQAREAVEGSYSFASIVWFDQLTAGLPGHRTLWELQPPATALATCALLAWTVWRLAGRWAAALTAVLVLCASEQVLTNYLRGTVHGTTFFAGALLAVLAVELTSPRPFGGRWGMGAAVVACGAIAGIHLVDALLWLIGIVPLAASCGLWWLRARDPASRRAALTAAATIGVALVAWRVTVAVMHHDGFATLPPDTMSPIHGLGELPGNVTLLGQLVFSLGNGALELSTAGLARGLLALACAGVMALGLLVPLGLLAAELRRPSATPARLVHLTFWSAVVVLLCGVMVVTNLGVDAGSARYVVPLLFAVAVSAPLLAQRAALGRAAVLAGAAVILTGSVVMLADHTISRRAPTVRAVLAAIDATARRTGATTGFADYYLSSNVTWWSHGRVRAYPVEGWTHPGRLCRFPFVTDASWYAPSGARRTFYLQPGAHPPPATLGRPIARRAIPGAMMFVYAGDISRRLCPSSS
jgi:hypothetical protein